MKEQHFFNRHVDFALTCLSGHEQGKPFHPTLHTYFKSNRQFGSRDRRTIKNLCYNWFRLGYSFSALDKKDQLLLAHVCLTTDTPEWMTILFEPFVLPPSWLTWELSERLAFLEKTMDWKLGLVFPDIEQVSSQVDVDQFIPHLFKQPLVWFRCKNENEFDAVCAKLSDLSIKPNGALGIQAGHLLESSGVSKQIEIQDYSSQEVFKTLNLEGVQSVWDCCCASGGKSLILLDRTKSINICASDSRKSILSNFIKRTGRHRYRVWSAVVNLSNSVSKIKFESKQSTVEITPPGFDLVVADLPCSGSGTWNRNPEFKSSQSSSVQNYIALQKQIVQSAWPFVKKGGRLLYTTCSVYKAENEDNVKTLDLDGMEVLRQGYVHGYAHNSDSMFFAELKKI